MRAWGVPLYDLYVFPYVSVGRALICELGAFPFVIFMHIIIIISTHFISSHLLASHPSIFAPHLNSSHIRAYHFNSPRLMSFHIAFYVTMRTDNACPFTSFHLIRCMHGEMKWDDMKSDEMR